MSVKLASASSPPTLRRGSAWFRPTDWIALPAVASGDKKFVGLHAVWNHDSNFVALTAAGAYTVDWGDGTSPENIATGVQANHNFVWANVSSATLTSGGYRQAIVTVTMQGAANLTSLNLGVKNSQTALNTYMTGWLDIRMASSALTSLTLNAGTVGHYNLQQFEYVGSSSLASTGSLFYDCEKLSNVLGTSWTSSCTDFNNMFTQCYSLQTIPLLDTHAGTTLAAMFASCISLQSIPLLNTSACTNLNLTFSGCSSLLTIPLLDTHLVTNFASTFVNCVNLRTIPLIDTHLGTTFASMFSGCAQLQTIPLLVTSAGTIFTSMFANCTDLQTIPLIDTHLGTGFGSMFNNCYSLQTVPLLVTSAGTTFTSIFGNCFSLSVGALSGTTKTISYSACRLSVAQVNAVYTALGTAVTQTITATGNWGKAAATSSIATAKGWTVA